QFLGLGLARKRAQVQLFDQLGVVRFLFEQLGQPASFGRDLVVHVGVVQEIHRLRQARFDAPFAIANLRSQRSAENTQHVFRAPPAQPRQGKVDRSRSRRGVVIAVFVAAAG